MKKKISLLFCTLAVILCFTGCGSNQKETLEYDKASVEQVTEFLINYCANTDEATMEQWSNMTDFALDLQLTQSGIPLTPESFRGALDTWKAGLKDCGEYQTHGDYTYTATNKEVTVTTEGTFNKRKGTITFIFDDQMYLDSMTINADYTKAEILEKAGLNTILGMGTVFVVLIFISLLISLFRFITPLQQAFTRKPAKVQEVRTELPAEEQTTAIPTEHTDDAELIAVISAAIAATEGTTTDGFIVRSIKRRPANKWN